MLTRSPDESPEGNGNNNEVPSLPVLEALREGVTNKDELRTSAISAWNAYLSACDLVMSTDEIFASPQFVRSALFPLIHQYVSPSSGLSHWTGAGFQQQDVCARACHIVVHQCPQVFEREWHLISSKIIEDFRTSLSEQSKDYNKSQDSIAAEAVRWYRLQAALIGESASEFITPTVKQVVTLEIAAAISLVKARNGKPYGSAAFLQTALELIPNLVLSEGQAKDALLAFADQDIPRLITSSSAQHLIRVLDLMESSLDVTQAYWSCMQNLEESSESPAKQIALKTLLSSPGLAKAGLLTTTASKSLNRAIDHALKEDDDQSWDLLMAAMGNVSAPKDLTENVLTALMNGLSIENTSRASLHGLELIIMQNKFAVRDFAAQPKGSNIMSKLLFISDAPEADVSSQAKRLTMDIEAAIASTGDIAQTTRPLVTVVQREFEVAGPESLSYVTGSDAFLKS